jgi:hypothetical protein
MRAAPPTALQHPALRTPSPDSQPSARPNPPPPPHPTPPRPTPPPTRPPPDLADQLRQSRAHNQALQMEVEALTGAVRRLQQHLEETAAAAAAAPRTPWAAASGAWQAASFLLLFLVVINVAGAIASFHLAASSFSWFGWFGVKPAAVAGSGLAKPVLSLITAAVPTANALVVLVFCVQAVKAAWLCLRF